MFNIVVTDSFAEHHSHDAHTAKAPGSMKRADIVDRNGELLAINLVTTSLYANPKIISDPVNTAKNLKQIFHALSAQDILDKLKSDKPFVWIKRNITPKEEQQVHDLGIPGLYFEVSEKRAYPHGSLFSHVLGYVGLDGNGLAGVERYFDEKLKYNKDEEAPHKLQLSLDLRAQNIMRSELEKTMIEFNARGAIGVLQDANNGEIIAMVSLPDYDPHNPGKASEEAMFNKASLGNYELGSAFKAFTVATALDTNTINLNDVYDVDTPLNFTRYQIKDFQGKGGWLSVPQILMHSSNIGSSQIALEVGKHKQFDYLKALGLLSQVEVELPEKSTPLYSPVSKWQDLTVVTLSYGYGLSTSPLNVTRAMSALVNGGKLYPTTLLKRESSDIQYTQVIKESTSEKMRKLLRMVVRFGSGRKAEVAGIFPAGKTGTALKAINGKYAQNLRMSSFMSTFPAHQPKYVMLITLDEPKGTKASFGFATGGWVSAPTSARIYEKLAPILGVFPEIEHKEQIDDMMFVSYDAKSQNS